jgi:ParB-like chromosome segregation protein Spo0J
MTENQPLRRWPADHVERRPLADLVPYAQNARTHSAEQIDALAKSITEWGWTIPVLVDETGELIAGHGRVLAAQQLGIAEAPVMVAAGWSPEQVRAYRIADNKLALFADWNSDFLADEFAALDGQFDLTLTGFGQSDIDKLLSGPDAPDEFTEFDRTIETTHTCPKCGFKWSGTSTSKREAAE